MSVVQRYLAGVGARAVLLIYMEHVNAALIYTYQ